MNPGVDPWTTTSRSGSLSESAPSDDAEERQRQRHLWVFAGIARSTVAIALLFEVCPDGLSNVCGAPSRGAS